MKKSLLSIFAMAALMLVSVIGYAQTTYTKINSVAELEAGAKYILVGYNNDGQAFVMSYQKNNNRHAIEIVDEGGSITTNVALSSSSQTEPYEFTLGGSAGEWTITEGENGGFVPVSNGGVEQNYMRNGPLPKVRTAVLCQ